MTQTRIILLKISLMPRLVPGVAGVRSACLLLFSWLLACPFALLREEMRARARIGCSGTAPQVIDSAHPTR